MSDFFSGSEDDLRAHQPDTQEFWVNAINLQAGGWVGGQPSPSSHQIPPPGYPYPRISASGYASSPGYLIPSQTACPQIETSVLVAIGTPCAWPMGNWDTSAAGQGADRYQIHHPAGGLKIWHILVGVILIVVILSSLAGTWVASKAPVAAWVDQVPTTANTWNQLCPQTAPSDDGNPYAIVGKSDLSADFVNKILAYYHSPTAGDGQELIDATSRCGIKVGAALAFFMHESTLGNYGEARSTLSIGNMRCIKGYPCLDGYTWFPSWKVSFVIWSRMMRNLYVDEWGEVAIDQVIPTYAPATDNNNEAAYIASWKHCIDTWNRGVIAV